ncbi:hypothetical protein trd_A0154 (plasmid) [Thermomicrobium roseum DSM 5159]|uniref:Uncharacterized protein n=1 Tax=Thermomicrobium roseum (strain ATCC 27502 / DSM 5159 / P-2) TaxID=309801 RepID=B9L2Z0_THERP|nr:hypothetical protein trd_A0154 [Thermomicrobium roseum DSM 5159]
MLSRPRAAPPRRGVPEERRTARASGCSRAARAGPGAPAGHAPALARTAATADRTRPYRRGGIERRLAIPAPTVRCVAVTAESRKPWHTARGRIGTLI